MTLKKMLIIESFDGLELLLFAGFLQWHYIFTIVFGILAVCIERTVASMLINNYETKRQTWIAILLTLATQLFAITVSCGVIFDKIGIIAFNVPWIITSVISVFVFFTIKRLNEDWQREIEHPRRSKVFTVSQRFQVKENLRALRLGKRLIISTLFTMVLCGSGVILLIFELVPPFLCHLVENCLFLNPFLICLVTMYSNPAWRDEFQKAFPCLQTIRNKKKQEIATVEPIVDLKTNLEMETDLYFKQLSESWV
ncbi:CBN-SRE-28 protein [Caenorhabditis brenneri]|uniref:CBN-SRE-28 protein n=1 Tax=Caenorhabditis brenneri TaxID=135651 RepID=G0NYZ1_CAEBE|nr:CBN-SRE-28 protein [Caenorhabditis brenneri]